MGARGTLRSSPGGLAILFVKGEARCVDRRHIETGAQLSGLIVESEAWRTARAERESRAQLALRIVKVQPRRAIRLDIQRDPRLTLDVGEIQSHRAIGQDTHRTAHLAVAAAEHELRCIKRLRLRCLSHQDQRAGYQDDCPDSCSKPAVNTLKFSLFAFQALKMLSQSCLRLL